MLKKKKCFERRHLQDPVLREEYPNSQVASANTNPLPATARQPPTFLWLAEAFQKLPLGFQDLLAPTAEAQRLIGLLSQPTCQRIMLISQPRLAYFSLSKMFSDSFFLLNELQMSQPRIQTLYNMPPTYLLGLPLSTLWLKLSIPVKLNILYLLTFSSIFSPPGYHCYFSLLGAYPNFRHHVILDIISCKNNFSNV